MKSLKPVGPMSHVEIKGSPIDSHKKIAGAGGKTVAEDGIGGALQMVKMGGQVECCDTVTEKSFSWPSAARATPIKK